MRNMKKLKFKNAIFENGFIQALERLAGEPISPAQGFILAKFIKQVNEKATMYNDQKNKLIKTYGKEDPKKEGSYTFTKENAPKVEKDFLELQNMEEEYEMEPIKLRDDVKINTKDLIMLEDILVE